MNNSLSSKRINNYQLIKRISSGGSSSVYLAENVLLKERVCIKQIFKNSIQSEDEQKAIEEELNMVQGLEHQNLVRFYEIVEEPVSFCIVMELCVGQTLLQMINERKFFHDKEAAKIIFQLSSVVAYLHAHGVAHRDLKPENIIISNSLSIKLIDFGSAATNISLLSMFSSSLVYSSPEIISNTPYQGSSHDMFAIGIILYVLVTGGLPWSSSNLAQTKDAILNCRYEIPVTVSPSCADLISKLLIRDPKARLSAAECLKHKWIKDSLHLQTPKIPAIISNMPPVVKSLTFPLVPSESDYFLDSNEHCAAIGSTAKVTQGKLSNKFALNKFQLANSGQTNKYRASGHLPESNHSKTKSSLSGINIFSGK